MSWLYSPLLPGAAQQLGGNTPPSVVLNSPADASSDTDTTPTLDFTGTDAEGNDARYEVQIDTRNDFVEDISVGNMSNGGVIASQSSETFSHNNNGEDVIVLVAIRDTETADTVTGVTYGGEAMTQDKAVLLEDDDSGADLRVYAYRKQGALTGANDVVISFSGSVDHGAAFAVSLSGLAQSGQPDATASDSDLTYGQDPDGAITTVAAKTIVLDVLYHKGDNLVVGGGQTEIGNLSPNGSGDKAAASYKIVSSAGSQSMNWSASSNDDWLQALVSYKARSVLLKKVSGTDSGFANPDNGGDTDPFNSGENIQYTVQAGDALAVGTYYWRVRAIDPSGSNGYGAWSSVRSFEVTSGGSGGTATPSVATMAMSIIAPAIVAGASIAATVLGAVFSIPPPVPSGGASIAPAVQSAAFSIQVPTVVGGANATPSVAEATFSVQAPTLSGGGVATPSVAEASFSAPTASASGGSSGNAEATPSVAMASFTLQNPAVSGGASTVASVLELTLNTQNPVPSGGGVVAPSVLTATFSIPIPTPSGGGEVLPVIAEATFSMPGGVAVGGATVAPAVLVATLEAPSAVASGVIIAYPDTAVLTFSALTPTSVIGGATAYPQVAVIGHYDLIYLIESDRYALRITGNMYLEL